MTLHIDVDDVLAVWRGWRVASGWWSACAA